MPTYLFDINPVPASRPRVSKYGTYYLATYRDFKDKMRQLIAQAPHLYKKYEGLLKVLAGAVLAEAEGVDLEDDVQ